MGGLLYSCVSWCHVHLMNLAIFTRKFGRKWPSFTQCLVEASARRPICGWPAAPDPPPARCCWRPQGNWPRRSMRKPWNSPAPLASAAPARLECLGVEFSLGMLGIWLWDKVGIGVDRKPASGWVEYSWVSGWRYLRIGDHQTVGRFSWCGMMVGW